MAMGASWKCADGSTGFNGGPCGPAPCAGECREGADGALEENLFACVWCGDAIPDPYFDGDTCSDECAREASRDRAEDNAFEAWRDARYED